MFSSALQGQHKPARRNAAGKVQPEQSPCKGSITIITFSIGMLPFQGGVLLVLTRRVAAGWLMLPLKGREKLTILPDIKILMLMYGYRLFAYRV
jgi:hypothetical protein